MPTSPPTIATPPTPPQRTDISTFVQRADAWVGWEETELAKIGTAALNTYDNAVEAAASAASAVAAAGSVSAPYWSSGTYAEGDIARSPTTHFAYRCLNAGSRTTDPALDPTNWALAFAAAPVQIIVTGTTQAAQAFAHYVLTNAAATTVTLPSAPAAGDLIWITAANGRFDNVIARNGKNIMGAADDVTINDQYATVRLRYVDTTRGWRIV